MTFMTRYPDVVSNELVLLKYYAATSYFLVLFISATSALLQIILSWSNATVAEMTFFRVDT